MPLKTVSMTGKYPLHATKKVVSSIEATEYGSDTRMTDHMGRGLYKVAGLNPVVADEAVDIDVYTLEPLNFEVNRGSEFPASGVLTVKPVMGRYQLTGSYTVAEHQVKPKAESKSNG